MRVTVQALAAVLGGTQSLHTNGYDEALALPTAEAATLALRTQQIVALRDRASRTPPIRWPGATTSKHLTDELERQRDGAASSGWTRSAAPRRAIAAGFFQEEIARSAYEHQMRVERGETVIVGVNRFSDGTEPPSIPTPDYSALERGQVERVRAVRAKRDAAAVGSGARVAARGVATVRREQRRTPAVDAAHHRRGARSRDRRRDRRHAASARGANTGPDTCRHLSMDWFSDPNAWLGLLTLTALEIVLGIDNIIFISILAGKLPAEQQPKARRLGLLGAFVSRMLLLLSIAWIVRLTRPLFEVFGHAVSGRDLILLLGGLFLIGKATHEIHDKLEGEEGHVTAKMRTSLARVVVQIMLIDIVFSLDSVITAVGMVDQVSIMVGANIIALGIMLAASGMIAGFVERHPTVKMLALSFLVVIGINLVAEGSGYHIPKGYTYFAMFFSIAVETLNIKARAKAAKPVKLHQPIE